MEHEENHFQKGFFLCILVLQNISFVQNCASFNFYFLQTEFCLQDRCICIYVYQFVTADLPRSVPEKLISSTVKHNEYCCYLISQSFILCRNMYHVPTRSLKPKVVQHSHQLTVDKGPLDLIMTNCRISTCRMYLKNQWSLEHIFNGSLGGVFLILKLFRYGSSSFENSYFIKAFQLKLSFQLLFLKQVYCWESYSSSHTSEAQSSNNDKPEETNVKFRQKGDLLKNSGSRHASDCYQYLLHFQPELQGKAWKFTIVTLFSTSTSNVQLQTHIVNTQAKQLHAQTTQECQTIKDVIQSMPPELAVQDFVLKGTGIGQDLQRKLDVNVTLRFPSFHQQIRSQILQRSFITLLTMQLLAAQHLLE